MRKEEANGWFRRQEEGSGIVSLLVLVGLIVGGFVAYKFIDAYRDISGIENDLERVARDLCLECIGDKEKEQKHLIPQIEDVKKYKGRKVVLDYSTIDYATSTNVMSIKGTRVVDLLVWKFNWHFTLKVNLVQ